MSACNTPVLLSPAASVAAPCDAPVTKGKSKTLPAKYAKFMQYTYYLIKKINQSVVDAGDMPLLPEDPVFEHARLFADVDAQAAFVQGFFDEAKDITKSIRAIVVQRKKDAAKAAKLAAKPPKAPKTPKPPKTTQSNAESQTVTQPLEKKQRKSKKNDKPDELVTELVLLATAANDPPHNDVAENVVLVTVDHSADNIPPPTPTPAKKPRKSRLPKNHAPPTTPVTLTQTDAQTETETETELDVQPINIDGTDYFLDSSNNLYSTIDHSFVRKI